MLPITWATVRVFLHVTAATIWVGGQLTLAGLVPGLRALNADAPRAVARRFNRIAWPAFGVLVATGIWNILAIDPDFSTSYGRTVMVKIADNVKVEYERSKIAAVTKKSDVVEATEA